jgi:hypothetical protein
MSDFDTVLERLLTDPAFTAALAADPATALRGYQLSQDELELLYAQVSTGAGGQGKVEERISKASLFGLFGGLMHDSGIGHAVGTTGGAHAHLGAAGDSSGFGPAGGGTGGNTSPLNIGDSLNSIVDQHSGGGGADGVVVDDVNTGGPLGHGITELPGGPSQQVPPDYHPHVDVDGDSRWDQYTVRARSDGGVDVVADMDHDGRPDFVGHDTNADGIIDSADYDKNHDGVFETHMTDTNGDGWMDRTTVDPR